MSELIRNNLDKAPAARNLNDVEHTLSLTDGTNITIKRAIRIREDGRVEKQPRIALPNQTSTQGLDLIAVCTESNLQALAALERRDADLAAITDHKLLEALGEQFPLIGTVNNGKQGETISLVTREIVMAPVEIS